MTKKLCYREVFAIILGAIIGWGSFMLPGTKFLKEAGVINTALGLFIGTCCIIIIEQSYRFMMHTHINEGGEFSYALQHLGKKHGFIVGWFLFLAYLTMIPLNALAFPLVINKLFVGVLNFGYLYTIAGDPIYLGEVFASVAIILFFMYFNLKGLKETGRLQTYIIYALIGCVVLVFSAMLIKTPHEQFVTHYILNYTFSLSEIAKVFAITPFLFIGFDAIPQLINDLHFSKGKASLLAVLSLFIGLLIYNLLNLTTALAYTPQEASTFDWALGSGVLTYLGKIGFILLIIALGAAVSSGINGFMICSTKLIGAMSQEGILPNSFSVVNSKGVLNRAIYFTCTISFLACWFGREIVIWIVDMSSVGAALSYFYVCLITYKVGDTYKTKHIALLGSLISLLFISLLLAPFSPAKLSFQSLACLIIWCLMGYYFWKKLESNSKNISF